MFKCSYLCICVWMCISRVFFFVRVYHVYHNNSMYTILSCIILTAYQASLLSDGIKSKISKLAKSEQKEQKKKEPLQHTFWSGTRIHDRLFFWNKSIVPLNFIFFFLSSLLIVLVFKPRYRMKSANIVIIVT